MNQRALKSAAYRLIKEYRQNSKSTDVQVKTQWTDGMLRGAQDMWRLVLGHLKPGGAVWESKRYKALDSLVAVVKREHFTPDIPLHEKESCEVCKAVAYAQELL